MAESSGERTSKALCVFRGSLGCDGLQEESGRLAAMFIKTGTGLMGGKNGVGRTVRKILHSKAMEDPISY